MKLQSVQQLKNQEQEELKYKILRLQEVEALTRDINVRHAKAEADFNDALAKNNEKWALQEEENTKLRNEAQEVLKRAIEKEQRAEDLLEMLEIRLTAVADREKELEEEKQLLNIAKEGLEAQRIIMKSPV